MVIWRKNKKEKKEKKDELEVKLRKGIWKTGKVHQEELNFFQAIGLQPTDQNLTDGVYQFQPAPYNSLQAVQQWLTDVPDNSKTLVGKGWSGAESHQDSPSRLQENQAPRETNEAEHKWKNWNNGSHSPDDIKFTAQYKDCLCDNNSRICYWTGAGHGLTRQNPQFKDCNPYQTCNCSTRFTGCSFWKHKPTYEFTRLNNLNITRLAKIRLAEKAKRPLKKIVLLKTQNTEKERCNKNLPSSTREDKYL